MFRIKKVINLNEVKNKLYDRNVHKISELTGIRYKTLLEIQKTGTTKNELSQRDIIALSKYFQL